MVRTITLVTLIDGDELSIEKSKAFTDNQLADAYFIELIKECFPNDCKDWTEDDFNGCLDDGYYQDLTHYCVYINEVPLITD